MTHPVQARSGSPERDFDFLIGAWSVRHRRLKTRLKGDVRWDLFSGSMKAQSILNGQGNFDQNVIKLPDGPYSACTLRIFHVAKGVWTIHWIDGRDPKIDSPMTGSFSDGVGTFHGETELEGAPIRVRFLWSGITPQSATWEQAFSADGGTSWEKNWTMEFTRV